MIVCVAVDDKNGMMFNKRRQSQDRNLREHLIKECGGSALWMNEYSAKQFGEEIAPNVIVGNDFLSKAGEEEYCFVENLPLTEVEAKINKLIIFKWNRVYPADTYFDISLEGWKMTETEEFVGSSHELITKEVWMRE
ncbi:MAG: ribonuclease Z [Lachnospiraceae bacterium]|nr:ribonuclease Z [Lachnospiraceae bacterium]